MTTISQQAAEVSVKLHACSESFRALRAVSSLLELAEGRNSFVGHEDAVPDLAALLAVIADCGFKAALDGLEGSQKLERVGGGL